MPAVFAHQRGSVVLLANGGVNGGVLPFVVRLGGMDMGGVVNQQSKAIITQAALVENGNYQFLHTLNETIYLYVFGDRIGELRVSGIAFSQLCPGDDSETGMGQVIRNYRENRIAKRGGPVIVSYGADQPFRAFLTGMSIEVVDPELMLGQWSYRFNSFPGRG